jgi:hypothetical protein
LNGATEQAKGLHDNGERISDGQVSSRAEGGRRSVGTCFEQEQRQRSHQVVDDQPAKFVRELLQREQHTRGSRPQFRRQQNLGTGAEIGIELNHRIVLSPFAAKRLTQLLQQLMKEYETRYGALSE